MLIIDLDGTLVTCNSFTEFVKFLFRRCPRLRMRLGWIVILRKCRLITHHEAKERIVRLAGGVMNDGLLDEFLCHLEMYVREELLEKVRSADRVVLATAAPAIYAHAFGDRIGIKEVCATETGGVENKGEEKVRSVERLGAVFDEKTVVITDSEDDRPLMDRNKKGVNLLV